MTPAEYEEVRQLLVNQKVMGLSLNSGGHLTHGYRHNISSKMMESSVYDVDPGTGLINYQKLAEAVKREKPAILIGGYSAYPRLIDFAKMREIADSVGATLLVDMAHFAGLVAGKVLKGNFDPIPFAHVVTSTTHKTLRGPRGGIVLCTNEYKPVIDKGCPLVLGGPLPHVIAAKAIAFKEANTTSFQAYAHQIVANAKALAETFLAQGIFITTNGTDNHLLVLDVAKSFGLNGRQAEVALRSAFFTVNRNSIPFDTNGAWYTSGIRIGPAALTTLGMKEPEMKAIANMIIELLKNTKPDEVEGVPLNKAPPIVTPKILKKIQEQVADLLKHFPLYPELIID
jgi:glycine hydroxymethyltransferase